MYLGKRYESCSFDSYIIKEYDKSNEELYKGYLSQVVAKSKAIEYAGLSGYESLILLGNSGTGKDHLVESILKVRKVDARVEEFELLSERKRAAQNTNTKWYDVLAGSITAGMLVLRDFGIRGQLSESQKELVYHIVNQRYDNMLPLIITSNLTPEAFKAAIDMPGQTRVYDRLVEMTCCRKYILRLTCESYRQKEVNND